MNTIKSYSVFGLGAERGEEEVGRILLSDGFPLYTSTKLGFKLVTPDSDNKQLVRQLKPISFSRE